MDAQPPIPNTDPAKIILEEVKSEHLFVELRNEWTELVERSAGATIYQTWEWNEAWWKVYGKRKRLAAIIARVDGRLIGLGLFYVSAHLNLPLQRLALVGTGASDYLDIVAETGLEREVALAILGRICEFHRFDLADLQQLRPDSTLLQGVGAVPQSSRKLAPEAIRMDSCPYLELPSTWTELAARFGKKMRSNLGYYDRLLVRDYPDTTIYLCDESTLGQGMNDLFELHQQRWKSRLMPGVMGSKKAQRFHRMVAERFLACGWLRLHITNSGNKAVAALYCFSFHGRYYYYLGGFAPELGKYSLGTTLTMHAIQQSITEKCKEFDFLRGNEPYKYRWLPEERLNERLLLSNLKGVKSRLLRKLNDWEREIEHRAKEFAEKRGRKG